MEIAKVIVGIVGILGMLGLPLFIITGVVLMVKASGLEESEISRKKSLKKKGILFIILSPALLIGSLIMHVIMSAIAVMMNSNV